MAQNRKDDSNVQESEDIIDEVAAIGEQENPDDGSLTIDSEETESKARREFIEKFTTDEEGDENEEPPDEEPPDEEPPVKEEPPDEETPTEEGDPQETDEAVDLGIDLSDVEEHVEEPDPDDGFDPYAKLPDWKKLPEPVRKHIDNFRRLSRKQEQRLKLLEPQAKWTEDVFQTAEKSGASPDEVAGWLEIGFRAQRGDEKAIETLGNIALKAGYKAKGVGAVDVEPIRQYLQDQVEEFSLTRDQAREILDRLEKTAPAAPSELPPESEPPSTSINQMNQHRQALQQAALDKLADLDTRFAKRFGKNWGEMRDRIRKEVVLEQAASPAGPERWPALWLEKAKAEATKAVKAQRRSRMNDTSDSLGRGEATRAPSNGDPADPRDSFHRRYSS